MLIINDVHISFNRKGGTTPASQEALRAYLFDSLRSLLKDTPEKHLLVLGDLFDAFDCEARDWMETYQVFCDWLGRGRTLTLVAGNHDTSPKGQRVSGFKMLADVLRNQFDGRVQVIDIGQWDEVWDHSGVYAVAHAANQDLFDVMVKEVLSEVTNGDYVLFHANYHNHFAAGSDHSLNISEEVAREFIDRGVDVIHAHEHQARREMPQGAKQTGAEVIVLGSQWATSISDCLGNDCKYAHVLRDGHLSKVETWRRDGEAGYEQVPWQQLDSYEGDAGFIRVCGEAKAHEAAAALNVIAKFRQKASCFVVSNAVAVEGVVQGNELAVSMEQTKAFDVLRFVREHLEPDEFKQVEWLLEKANG